MSKRIDSIEDYISEVFAKNKALFGDALMELVPDDTPEPVEDETPPESDAPDESGEAEETETPEPEKAPEDELPEWARKELTSVRGEAANYRTKLREAEAKLSEAKTPEDFEAAVSELRETNAKLEREILVTKAATKHNLPEALAARLTGNTPEEIEADAKALAELVSVPRVPDSLEGGLDPNSDDDGEMDPRKLAARFRRT